MAQTLDQIIKDLEAAVPAEKTAAAFAAETTAAPVVTTDTELEDMQKKAADADAEGRIIARAFVDEIQKIAVEVTGLTPNTAAVPENPAVQVSTEDAHLEDVSKVEAIIKKLTMGGEAKVNPAGAIHEQNVPVEGSQPIAVDEHPIAADAKMASNDVLEALYTKWFQD